MALFGNQKENTEKEEQPVAQVATAATAPIATTAVKQLLVQPRISEKASQLAKDSKYIFVVHKDANKVEIRKAVESAYKVNVVQVNIINNKGKLKNFGQRSGKRSDLKKAIVTLKAGEKIEIAEVV